MHQYGQVTRGVATTCKCIVSM